MNSKITLSMAALLYGIQAIKLQNASSAQAISKNQVNTGFGWNSDFGKSCRKTYKRSYCGKPEPSECCGHCGDKKSYGCDSYSYGCRKPQCDYYHKPKSCCYKDKSCPCTDEFNDVHVKLDDVDGALDDIITE